MISYCLISNLSICKGCRYRRRGIDERGYVANYVETEQVLEISGESSVHILSFLQIRGSVPVFWTQTGIKYKPPIQLHKSMFMISSMFYLFKNLFHKLMKVYVLFERLLMIVSKSTLLE